MAENQECFRCGQGTTSQAMPIGTVVFSRQEIPSNPGGPVVFVWIATNPAPTAGVKVPVTPAEQYTLKKNTQMVPAGICRKLSTGDNEWEELYWAWVPDIHLSPLSVS